MYTVQPKKMLIINILDILKNYTDAEHTLSQQQIIDILDKEYEMKADRKAVKRNLMNLIDFGYNIEYKESTRMTANGEETLLSDWYLVRDFSDSELRLLIDSLLFSKHIPQKQCHSLIEKIEGLSNKYFKSSVNYISNTYQNSCQNKQLFYNIEIIDEAIKKKLQIEFVYNQYGTDKKLHPKLTTSGEKKKYVINPYQMVATNGKYYLVCNYDKYNDIGNYRIDLITEIKLLTTVSKPQSCIPEIKNGLDLPRHMAEHIYMFPGKSERVIFEADKFILNDLFDWFGEGIEFLNEKENTLTVSVKVNIKAMHYWSLQYVNYIKVKSPSYLVNQIKQDLTEAVMKYTKECEDNMCSS